MRQPDYYRPIFSSEAMRKYSVLLSVSAVLGLIFHTYLFYSENNRFPASQSEWLLYLPSLIAAIAAGFIAYLVDGKLDQWVDWKRLFFSRFLAGFFTNTIVISLLLMAVGSLFVQLITTESLTQFYTRWQEEIWKLAILTIITFFVYEVFYGVFYSYRSYAIRQVDHLRSDRWQLELQFESLKSQISPHYLFNCLNTISSLVYKDSRKAEEFIRRMADTFRYVITNQKQKLVTLREEIEFIKAYYYLLQVRYEDHLKLEINLPKNVLDSYIPPLALQLLVENTVKHNQISKEHPLLVYISAVDNTHLTVTSTKTEAINSGFSFNVGLNNIQKRYQFFTDEKIVIKDEEKFSIQLPVIKVNGEMV